MTYTFDKRKINRRQKPSGSQKHQVNREMLPNSLVSRIMEDPGAEKEASQLVPQIPGFLQILRR